MPAGGAEQRGPEAGQRHIGGQRQNAGHHRQQHARFFVAGRPPKQQQARVGAVSRRAQRLGGRLADRRFRVGQQQARVQRQVRVIETRQRQDPAGPDAGRGVDGRTPGGLFLRAARRRDEGSGLAMLAVVQGFDGGQLRLAARVSLGAVRKESRERRLEVGGESVRRLLPDDPGRPGGHQRRPVAERVPDQADRRRVAQPRCGHVQLRELRFQLRLTFRAQSGLAWSVPSILPLSDALRRRVARDIAQMVGPRQLQG